MFRSTSQVAVQALPYEFDPAPTEKSTVAVGMDHPSCYDFSGQFNSATPFFFSSSDEPNTANASSGTEQQILDFDQNATICYETQRSSDVVGS
ncbi:unnamed protein product [Heligmosomoides polygyrus]|uniref:Ovule protein n=1 Tax=Heligmosomoides polygyrus TaxID=6339 RepID=A0A183G2H9_HELPZ|nr:unnamed protein product [Heligmosomoides polygyrus]